MFMVYLCIIRQCIIFCIYFIQLFIYLLARLDRYPHDEITALGFGCAHLFFLLKLTNSTIIQYYWGADSDYCWTLSLNQKKKILNRYAHPKAIAVIYFFL